MVLQDDRLGFAQGLGRVGAGVLDAEELDLAPVEAAGIVEPGDPGLKGGVDPGIVGQLGQPSTTMSPPPLPAVVPVEVDAEVDLAVVAVDAALPPF